MRKAITYFFYPLTLLVAVIAGTVMIQQGIHELVIVGSISFTAGLWIFLFEYIHPEHKNWKPTTDELGVDFLHFFISSGVPPVIVKTFVAVLFTTLAITIQQYVGFDLWPHTWPLWAQMLLAIHLGDLGYYIVHRSLHTFEKIWPFHAVHHSPSIMYVIVSGRAHPLQILVSFGMQMSILWTLGINAEALVLFAIFVSVHGMVQHSNVKMRCGILNWVFATPELHRWHHSQVIEESNSNYGNNVIFWDVLFGTRFFPKKEGPFVIGLPDGTNFPRTFWGHMKAPFMWSKIRHDRE